MPDSFHARAAETVESGEPIPFCEAVTEPGSVFRRLTRFLLEARIGLALTLLAVMAVHVSFFRGHFGRTPGDPSDAALIAYLVERDYRWLVGLEHTSFWNPPMFYPHRDTATYTDTLLGALPLYAPFRVAGVDPATAFQLWVLAVGCCNYLALYLFLKKLLRYGELACNAGAFLFACGSARLIQEWHPQLVPEFYVVMSLAGLVLFFRKSRAYSVPGSILFFGGLVMQVYTAVYWAVFLVFCCLLGLLFCSVRREYRMRLIFSVTNGIKPILAVGLLSAICVAPLVIHSIHTAKEVGLRTYESVQGLLPGWTSWLRQGSESWMYGALDGTFKKLQSPGIWEDANGIGFVTSAIVILGFLKNRRCPVILMLGFISAACIVCTLRLYDGVSLWRVVYFVFPGARAIRAVCRIGLFLSLPFAIGAASFIQGRKAPFAFLFTAILVGEQLVSLQTYDKRYFQELVVRTDTVLTGQSCEAFLFSPSARDGWTPVLAHSVAIWASLNSSRPTINASSGASPPGWEFADSRVSTPTDILRLRQAIIDWRSEHKGRPGSLCWIRADGEGGSLHVWNQ